MGEEIAFENGRISDFQGLVTLTLETTLLGRLGGVNLKINQSTAGDRGTGTTPMNRTAVIILLSAMSCSIASIVLPFTDRPCQRPRARAR